MWSQDVVGTLYQQTSKISVASLGDAELRIAFTRLAAFRSETKVATDVSTASESTLIPECQDKRKGGDVADPMDGHHGLCLNILGLSESLNILVILLDLESHLRDLSEDRTERQLQSWRHRCLPSLREALRGRSRHTMAACLRQSTNRVDGRGSQTDKKLASADQCEGLLLLDGAMRDRPEDLRIEPRVTCQLLRIYIVALAVAVRDRSQLAYVRHDHLVAQLLKLFADPDRVNTGLHRHTGVRHRREPLVDRLRCGSETTSIDDVAVLLRVQ